MSFSAVAQGSSYRQDDSEEKCGWSRWLRCCHASVSAALCFTPIYALNAEGERTPPLRATAYIVPRTSRLGGYAGSPRIRVPG